MVTCADPRICPEEFLGLQPGEAVVFRTAGGHVHPVLQDILTLDSFLGNGQLNQLIIVHHTDCGASHFTNNGIKTEIISRYAPSCGNVCAQLTSCSHPDRKAEVEQWNVGAFEQRSIAESVRDDMDLALKDEMVSDNLKRGMRGFVLDIKTGKIEEA